MAYSGEPGGFSTPARALAKAKYSSGVLTSEKMTSNCALVGSSTSNSLMISRASGTPLVKATSISQMIVAVLISYVSFAAFAFSLGMTERMKSTSVFDAVLSASRATSNEFLSGSCAA